MAWLNHVLCLHCHCVLTRLHKKKTRYTATGLKNGAKRTRTADPLHAMQVLYQLSYGPLIWQASLATSFILHRGLVLIRPGAKPPPASPGW